MADAGCYGNSIDFYLKRQGFWAKMLLLMPIDVALLAAFGIMLPPAPSVVQGVCSEDSEARVYTRAKRPPRERLRSDGPDGSNPPWTKTGLPRIGCGLDVV